MTYQTHAYFGEALHTALCETWGATLSRKRLVRGSIKPDMSSLFVRHPHFWKHSHKYVERKIRKLERAVIVPGKKNGRFSEDLGIVLHYVADYFTAVHNVRPNPIREHMEYETRLYSLFRELVDEDSLATSMRLIARGVPHGAKRALRELRAAYEPNPADPVNDVRFITMACLAVAARIMDAATENLAVSPEITYVN